RARPVRRAGGRGDSRAPERRGNDRGDRGHRIHAGRSRGEAGLRRRGDVVRKLALAGLLIMAAAGAWLVAAPFVLHYQPSGARWTGAARMDMAVGVVVAAVGLAGFFGALAGGV